MGPLHAVRVLVVDDDPDMRQILRAWIEQAGATVRSAADGTHALCHVPVLVLSGEMDPAGISRTWEAGFSGHLVKPVTKDAVLARSGACCPRRASLP